MELISSLFAFLGGGGLRLIPEILNFFQKRREIAAEIEMRKIEVEVEKWKIEKQIDARDMELDAQQWLKATDALIEATKAQAAQPSPTGVKWLDIASGITYILSQSVRPVVTYWWLIVLYTSYKISLLMIATNGGVTYPEAIVKLWTPEDQDLIGAMMGFWFLGRVFDKK